MRISLIERTRERRGTRLLVAAAMALALVVAGGCRKGMPTVPVSGKVTYKGQPLKFGSVLFQPEVGPTARGAIQPDGTFTLSTDGKDGAVVGKHRVEIKCATTQDPSAPPPNRNTEQPAGKSLIPERYTSYGTSGFEVEVKSGMEPVPLDLKD